MSVNSSNDSSSSCGDSVGKIHPITFCLLLPPASSAFVSFCLANILILFPLCVFVLRHVLRLWRGKKALSHADCYTFQSALMELVQVSSGVLGLFGVPMCRPDLVLGVFFSLSMVWMGEVLLHLLTSVERYLAVVHPVTYLGLRKERGTRIRNISLGCMFPLSLLGMTLWSQNRLLMVLTFTFLFLSMALMSFCSLSILQVLIRPRPGDQEGNKERLDQSKRRALSTIVTILGALVLRLSVSLAWVLQSLSGRENDCVLMVCGLWCSLPSSLVLPLLFLLNKSNVACCEKTR